jgi:hypothetical protein
MSGFAPPSGASGHQTASPLHQAETVHSGVININDKDCFRAIAETEKAETEKALDRLLAALRKPVLW